MLVFLCVGEDMVSTDIYYIEINAICIIVLLIMLLGNQSSEPDNKSNLFKGMLLAGMVLCFSDMLAGIFRGSTLPGIHRVLWIANMTYFLASFAWGVLWILYSMVVLWGRIYKTVAIIVCSAAGVVSLIFLSAPFNGLAFTISGDNLYQRGPLIWLQWLIAFPCLLFPMIVAPFTHADKREKLAITSFPIFPFLALLIQAKMYGITVGQAGATTALLMLYVLFQSRSTNDAIARASILAEMSNTDSMTGLRNRRAYELKLEEVLDQNWVGVVFADLNGLKRENDINGHKAGDEMIVSFAKLLTKYFDEKEVFRISGDEFVVLSTDKSNYLYNYEKFKLELKDEAAIGIGEGKGMDIDMVIGTSEKNMYQDKREYYLRSGMNRRG